MRLRGVAVLVVCLLVPADYGTCLEDLIAEESHDQPQVTDTPPPQPKRFSSQIKASHGEFGQKTAAKKTVLDFRIESLRAAAAGQGAREEAPTKTGKDDDDEKTLAQQVADGKYGLIQNELFPHGSKRPGIISYKSNPEVPADTAKNLGGLDKEEIWLAEDHVLVLRGGAFPQNYNATDPRPWSAIDDYIAPNRQVQIPKNPKIPPPFPVQLFENGPLQFIRGENGSFPPRPPFLPPFPPPGFNGSFPFPVPPGPAPPFLPPGAAFLPPVGNLTDFDEDDPSIYYPPKYDFNYPTDNTTAVPPGPLVPGIILPPPPHFFKQEEADDQENETDGGKPPFVGPVYLPSERHPPSPSYGRKPSKRPTTIKTTTQSPFTSPIYVPNTPVKSAQQPHPPLATTSPRPNHISIPKNKTLKQDIYIISTEPPDIANDIIDIIRETKPNKPTSLDGISADRHPLRSLLRPQVSVNYIGKVGHLPPSTPFPFTRSPPPNTTPPPISGHFLTFPPSVSVTSVPVVRKFHVKPTQPPQNHQATLFYFEEPTEATPAHENDVSASPIDQFLKSNLQSPNDHYIHSKQPQKVPEYVPARTKPKYNRKPFRVSEDVPKQNSLDINPEIITLPPPTFGPVASTTTSATDGPFIPSNYYATANPANMHFTKFDPTIVDDITMKYFTIFGQKINGGGTTPITPGAGTTPRSHIAQSYTSAAPPTTTPAPITITTSYPSHVYKPPRPQSQFEQYLHEITGEDQTDYVITHKTPTKIKKPKARPLYSDAGPKIQHYYLPYRSGGVSEYIENIYRNPSSSGLRGGNDVEIRPEYFTTAQPYVQIQTQQPPPYRPKPLSHNLGQYLQEVVYPAASSPPRTSNLDYYQPQKPPTLHTDVLVNYRHPLPAANPHAELLPSSYIASSSHSNIKVVQPPNLTQPQRQRPVKSFLNTLPQSTYFPNPQQNSNAHAFVAYSLPDNGGHFYFLTPQAQARSDDDSDEEDYGGPLGQIAGDRLSHRQGSQQHLPRRRKKSS